MPGFDKSLSNIGQYLDDQGVLQDVDNEFVPAVAPWGWEMLNAGYHIRVKDDFTAGQIIEFEVDGFTLQLQPMALEYTNDLDQIQQISMPQAVSPTVTNPPSGVVPDSSDGTITWENGYGTGRHFAWKCTPRRLNKTLTIENLNNLPIPDQSIIDGGNPVLRLNLIFDPPKKNDVDIVVDGQVWNQQSDIQTFNMIEFVKDGEVLWGFMPLLYWDSEGNEGQSVATLEKRGNKLYISIRVPYEWLQSAVYPVFIDADVQIEGATQSWCFLIALRAGPFWASSDVGYVIYVNTSNDLKYRKTVNGGANWGAAVNIRTGTVLHFDCHPDWQTAGDAGTKIHIAYIDKNTNDVRYVYLDTDGDSVGGDDQIEAAQGTGLLYNHPSRTVGYVSITKTRGGNLAVALRYGDSALAYFYSFYTSPDATTWTSKTSPWEANNNDLILLFPGNEADNQDVWATFWDASADEIMLKTYDDSGNSWSEQLISAGMLDTGDYLQMDGQVNLDTGHLIFAAWSQYNNAASDLKVWDINGAGSITAKTNIITDTAEYAIVSVFINQVNDDIYIAYLGGTDFTSLVKAFYQKSVNGGTSWGGQQALQADVEDDERWISAGAMNADWGGKFQPFWYNGDLFDLFTNTDNGIEIAAAAGGTDYVKNLSDTFTIGDSISKAVTIPKSDSVGIADSISKESGLIKADSMAVADSLIKSVGLGKADSVGITDSFDRTADYVVPLSDSVSIADSFDRTADYIQTLADSVAISDSIAKVVTKPRADTLTIADSIIMGFARIINLADSLGISDSISKGVGKVRADTLAIADTVSKAVGLTKSDSFTIADSFDRISDYVLAISDTVGITDAISKTVGIVKTDTLAITDIISKAIGLIKSESFAIADTFDRTVASVRSFSDNIAIADVILKTVTIAKSDLVSISDSLTKSLTSGIEALLTVRVYFSTRAPESYVRVYRGLIAVSGGAIKYVRAKMRR